MGIKQTPPPPVLKRPSTRKGINMQQAILCPQCNAPLAPHPFARTIVCAYCGTTVQLDNSSVAAERFREAWRIWNEPASFNFSSYVSSGERHWAVEQLLAQGEFADVYNARRARCPTELVTLKILRDGCDPAAFENEWTVLQSLQNSKAAGAATFLRRIPQPVLHGTLSDGIWGGRSFSIFRRAHGFQHTFEAVRQAYPAGIAAQASIWVWRRILETLSFLHNSGVIHGAVVPAHLLVQDNEHGVRLVGYGHAALEHEKLSAIPQEDQDFYPAGVYPGLKMSPALDIIMSARCMSFILGGDPHAAALPSGVPQPLADYIRQAAGADPTGFNAVTAWKMREELGQISDRVFGPPRFLPINMP